MTILARISQSAGFSALVLFVAMSFLFMTFASLRLEGVAGQQIIQPRWVNIPYPSGGGTYTRLLNGIVIRVGYTVPGAASAEIFNPFTGQWRNTAPMLIPRHSHDAHLLPDGRLLVVGGYLYSQYPPMVYAGPPEIYDPVTESWNILQLSGGDLSGHYSIFGKHAVTALMKNGKIMFISGVVGTYSTILDPETDIIEAGQPFPQQLGSVPFERRALIPLFDGRLLFTIQDQTLLYDPADNTWTTYSFPENLNFDAAYYSLLLSDGSLISSLGRKEMNSNDIIYSTGMFDILTGQWKQSMESGSVRQSSCVLTDGRVITINTHDITATLYDPSTNTLEQVINTETSHPLGDPLLLADGRVLSGTRMYGYDFDHSFTSISTINVSAASFRAEPLARGSIAALFGSNLPQKTPEQHYLIFIRDTSGTTHEVIRIFGASQNQINYLIPDDIPTGQAELSLTVSGTQPRYALVSIVDTSPGLFTVNANGQGTPAAVALRLKADGSQSYESITDGIDPGDSDDRVFLVLFGTGIRHRIQRDEYAFAYLGGTRSKVLYAGENGAGFDGLDQVNIEIPRSLAGRGDVDLLLTVDGKTANPVTLRIN